MSLNSSSSMHIVETSREDKAVKKVSRRRRGDNSNSSNMEKYFGNAYRGDPGVPHADPDRFFNIWIGSAAFSVMTFINPYMWHLTNQFNWHDKAFLFEQYHWKKAMKKNQPYQFKWNEMDREIRDNYYINWPIYFP